MNTPADQGHLTLEGASGSGLGPVESRDQSTGGAAGGTGVPVPVAQPGRGTTNVAYASDDAETDPGDGTGDLRGKIEELLIGVLGARHDIGTIAVPELDGATMLGTCSAIELARDAADAVVDLAAGWRPPLPEQSEGPSPWDAYVAAYREYQETEPHGATAHPTAHHMHAVEAALRVYDPCTEHGDLIHRFVSASLEFDYTAEGDCGGEYDDDAAEREAAIANVVEMHRLLNVRAERLAEAHEKLRALSSPLPDSETEKTVADFCAERAQYVTALKQNTDGGADYHRWQGHAEARRQLSERLGREVTS